MKTLPENVDFHMFRNRQGMWVIRVPTEAVAMPLPQSGKKYHYTRPAKTPGRALYWLAEYLRDPSDFDKKLRADAQEKFMDPEFCKRDGHSEGYGYQGMTYVEFPEPNDAEMAYARQLHEQGYFQVSRKYRRVGRVYGPDYDPYSRTLPVSEIGPSILCEDTMDLTKGVFSAFHRLKDEYQALLYAKFDRENGIRKELLEEARKKFIGPHACEAFVAGAMYAIRKGLTDEQA